MLLWLQLEEKGALFKFLTAQLSSWIGALLAGLLAFTSQLEGCCCFLAWNVPCAKPSTIGESFSC